MSTVDSYCHSIFQVDTASREDTVEQPSKVSILEEMSLIPNQDEIDELVEPEPQQPVQLQEEQGISLSDNRFINLYPYTA